MKNSIVFILVFLTSILSNSQNEYKVREQILSENPLATSYTIEVIGAGERLAIDHWQEFIEKHKGTSYVLSYGEGDMELESQQVDFPFLNHQKVTIHSRFSPNSTESGVLVTIWIEFKDGTYFYSESAPSSSEEIKNWLLAFREELVRLNRTH